MYFFNIFYFYFVSDLCKSFPAVNGRLCYSFPFVREIKGGIDQREDLMELLDTAIPDFPADFVLWKIDRAGRSARYRFLAMPVRGGRSPFKLRRANDDVQFGERKYAWLVEEVRALRGFAERIQLDTKFRDETIRGNSPQSGDIRCTDRGKQ